MTPEQMAAIERVEKRASNARGHAANLLQNRLVNSAKFFADEAGDLEVVCALARQPSQCGEVEILREALKRIADRAKRPGFDPIGDAAAIHSIAFVALKGAPNG